MASFSLSKVIPLPASVQDPGNDAVFGSYTADTKLCWLACGPNLQVLDPRTGNKISQWTFGAVLKDASTKIVAVQELATSYKEVTLLVVGLECMMNGGMICIFDVFTWKVVRAIQLREKVTSVHVINSGNEVTSFPGPLNTFDGALAVGTAGGNIYIIDLCRQAVDEARQVSTNESTARNEIDPCLISVLTCKDLDDIERYKEVAERNGNHLAIHLNAQFEQVSPHFTLKGPRGEDRMFVNREEVRVSSLLYARQLSSLLVGFNFGALQIWNLLNMTVIYTSPVYEENIPVSHFAVQEPVDDPRAFCYFWAVYSHDEPYQKSLPVTCLYSLSYESKDWHEGYGYIYQNLQSCAIRFQADLLSVLHRQGHDAPLGAQCLRLHSFNKGTSRDIGSNSSPESQDESYTLCLTAWNLWYKDHQVFTCMSIFDLNQWYKDQMPSSLQPNQGTVYMANTCLSAITGNSTSRALPAIDVHISSNTISQFVGAQRLEEHYYPTSLAFECLTLSEHEVCIVKNHGHQRKLFRDLEVNGPLALMKPSELYENSVALGLTPLFVESQLLHSKSSISQREFLLSVALERGMKNWLCKCAASWGNGSHRAAGLSMDLLLNWAWERANILKTSADNLCVSLFDCSDTKLDENANKLLSKCRNQILVLRDLYAFVFTKCSQFIVNPVITRKQFQSLQNIFVYLDVLGWMINVGLLPECNLQAGYTNAFEKDQVTVPYSVEGLKDYYKERRSSLLFMNTRRKLVEDETLLYIDKLVGLCGNHLIKEWKCCEDDSGKYPPSSFQAVLRTYLMDEGDLQLKHTLVTYFFLDLATSLDASRYKSIIPTLIKFPTIFQLAPSIIKVTQAFWHLDHGELGTAAEQLIDPMIKPSDLSASHHKFVLQVLMLQDHHKLALIYFKVRQPPLNDISDITTTVCLYIQNSMLHEAFRLIRRHDKSDNMLLNLLFKECLMTDQLHELLNMDLSRQEEDQLLKFMENCNFNENENFKAMYYMLRGRYMDFKMYSGGSAKGDETDGKIACDLKNILSDVLPDLSKNLMKICMTEKLNLFTKDTAPKPMSSFLHNQKEYARYKFNLVTACIAKSRETWADPIDEKSEARVIQADFPFVRVPSLLTNKHRSNSEVIYTTLVTHLPNVNLCEEDGPSPTKRLKLSPRESVHTDHSTSAGETKMLQLTKIETPIIKRVGTPKPAMADVPDCNPATPQSILKVHPSSPDESAPEDRERGTSTTPENLSDINEDGVSRASCERLFQTRKGGSYASLISITPRKSLLRSSSVRFSDVNMSASQESASPSTSTPVDPKNALDINPLPGIPDTSLLHNSISSYRSSSVFHTTETRKLRTFDSHRVTPQNDDLENRDSRLEVGTLKPVSRKSQIELEVTSGSPTVTANKILILPFLHKTSSPTSGPKSRRTYKQDVTGTQDTKSSEEENPVELSDLQRPPSRLSARKSLARQVLENNTLSKLSEPPVVQLESREIVSIKQTSESILVENQVHGNIREEIFHEIKSSDNFEKSYVKGYSTEIVKEHTETSRYLKQITEESVYDMSSELEQHDLPFEEEMEVDLETPTTYEFVPNFEVATDLTEVLSEETVAVDNVPVASTPVEEEVKSGCDDKIHGSNNKPSIEISDEDSMQSMNIQYSSARDVITLDSSSNEVTNGSPECVEQRRSGYISNDSSEDSHKSDFDYVEGHVIELECMQEQTSSDGFEGTSEPPEAFDFNDSDDVAVIEDSDEDVACFGGSADILQIGTNTHIGEKHETSVEKELVSDCMEINEELPANVDVDHSECDEKMDYWLVGNTDVDKTLSGDRLFDDSSLDREQSSKSIVFQTDLLDLTHEDPLHEMTCNITMGHNDPLDKTSIEHIESPIPHDIFDTPERTTRSASTKSTEPSTQTKPLRRSKRSASVDSPLATPNVAMRLRQPKTPAPSDDSQSDLGLSTKSQIHHTDVFEFSRVLDKSIESNELSIPRDIFDTPGRTTRSTSTKSTEPSTPTKSLRRSLRAASVESPLGTPKIVTRLQQTKSPTRSGKVTKRRHSSANVTPFIDLPVSSQPDASAAQLDSTPITVKKVLRTRSVDCIVVEPVKSVQKTRGRRSSVLPVIDEEIKNKASSSMANTYSTNRRLTRRQKELMEKHLKPDGQDDQTDEKASGSEETFELDMHTMDRIELLDRKEFQGVVDPDEGTLLQESPTSSFVSSTATDTNAAKVPTKPISPKSNSLRSSKSADLNFAKDCESGTQNKPTRRKRRQSQESAVSEASTEPRRSTRSRTKSEMSDANSTVVLLETKAKGKKKQTLSKISEETSSELLGGESGSRKVKKTAK